MKNMITRIKNRFTDNDNDLHKAWRRERERAKMFGQSHVEEVDAIFSRYI